MKFTYILGAVSTLGHVYAHTILHKINGNAQGQYLYMPSSDNVRSPFRNPVPLASVSNHVF
jgi:hypothetical protein